MTPPAPLHGPPSPLLPNAPPDPAGAERFLAALSDVRSPDGSDAAARWDPPFCGKIDMRIARDGSWHYQGSPIARPAMVQLFASILRREGARYFLVTPVEKVEITVEDAPLFADDLTVVGEGPAQELHFTTRCGARVTAGAAHPVHLGPESARTEPAPYLLIRRDLWARIGRKTFYQMVERGCHARHEGASWFGIWSMGQFFPMIPSCELT